MNTYLYGGKTKSSMTVSVVDDNEQLEVGKTYIYDCHAANGGFLIAYPN